MVLFQFCLVWNFGKLINFGFGTVGSERVKITYHTTFALYSLVLFVAKQRPNGSVTCRPSLDRIEKNYALEPFPELRKRQVLYVD